MPGLRPPARRRDPTWQLALHRLRQQRPQPPGSAGQRAEQPRARGQQAQPVAQQALPEAARQAFGEEVAADIQQLVVLDSGRAGGFAVAAAQAAIEVQASALAGLVALEKLLDQVDPSARAVEFVAQLLVGRAGGVAETAVHAAAQDALGFGGLGALPGGIAEVGLHRASSEFGVHPPGIEDALRVELAFESPVQAEQSRR